MVSLIETACLLALLPFLCALPAPSTPNAIHTVPLRRVPLFRDGEHPHLAFERHANAATQRLARMTGQSTNSPEYHAARAQRRAEIERGEHFANFKRLFVLDLPDLADATFTGLGDLAEPAVRPGLAKAEKVVNGVVHAVLGTNGDVPQAADATYGNSNAAIAESQTTSGNLTAPINATATSAPVNPNATAPPIYTAPNTVTSTASATAAQITVTQSGSNKNGYSPILLAASQQLTNTPSTVQPIDGGVGLEIEWDNNGYYAEIVIGSKGEKFNVLLDSGSSDLWVKYAGCQYCGNHTGLDSSTSDTLVINNTVWQTTYGAASVGGVMAQDDVTIAGMTIKGHHFGIATVETIQFSNNSVPFDGIMGLALDSLSHQHVITAVEGLAAAALVGSATMGYALGSIRDGDNDGEAVFGGVDPARFDASTSQILPVTSTNGYWQVAFGGVVVNGKRIATANQAIFDTGTTLIQAPTADADAVHAQIPGAKTNGRGYYTVPCTTNATVFLQFGNAAFQINPPDLLYHPVDSDDLKGDCLSSIVATDQIENGSAWLLGDAFLRNVYFATNVHQTRAAISKRT